MRVNEGFYVIAIPLNAIRALLNRDVAQFASKTESIKATFCDHMYTSPTRPELEAILQLASQAIPKGTSFQNEIFDCDDFTFVLKGQISIYGLLRNLSYGLAFGIAWAKYSWRGEFHAANFAIINGTELVWIEPQELSIEKQWGIRLLQECRGDLTTLVL